MERMRSGVIRRGAIAFLLVALIGTVRGSNAVQSGQSSTTSPTSITAVPTTKPPGLLSATSTKTTTESKPSVKNPPLYLPVTTASPDPLGIAKVSGVYGPGTWAGWFLTLVAAWWRILRASEEKVDPNTWAFLFGCNWAAVDVLRSIRSITTAATATEARSKYGLYAAAFNVTFWGLLHSLCQFGVSMIAFKHRDGRNRRLRTLAIGMVLPVIALQAIGIRVLKDLDSENDFIPALYWRAMGHSTHELIILLVSWTPIIIVLPACIIVLAVVDTFAPTLTALVRTVGHLIGAIVGNETAQKLMGWWAILSFPVWYVSTIALGITNNDKWIFGFIPFAIVCAPFFMVLIPFIWFLFVPFYCVIYVFKAYFHLGSNVSGSCFFMPCAPQSISDSDQLYPLIFGLLSFVGYDAFPVVYKEVNTRFKRWQENRTKIEETAVRLREHELSRISTPGLTRRNTPGTVV